MSGGLVERRDGAGAGASGVRRLKSPESSALELLSEVPRRTGLLTDFDGTLSRIVVDPETARAIPGALDALHGLARELAVVAAVSGRPAEFLAERLEMERYRSPLRAIGLHGLEEWQPDGSIRTRSGVEAWRPAIEDARDTLIASVPAGVRVEDKGLGVTVHWFSLTVPRAELEMIAARASEIAVGVATEKGLVSRPGKSSVELAPPIGIDKGTVVTELCGGLERAGYLGDDAGDLLAFRALDELKDEAGLRTIKIAVSGVAAPQALLADADLVLGGPDAAVSLLVELARILRPG